MEELNLKFTREELNIIYDLVREQTKKSNSIDKEELLKQIVGKMDKFYLDEVFSKK